MARGPAAADNDGPAPAPQVGGNNFGNDGDIIAASENPNDFMTNIATNTKLWAHPLRKGFSPSERIDLTETVLFSSASVVTNGQGQGTFYLSDLITKFRVTVNAIDVNGVVGYQKTTF